MKRFTSYRIENISKALIWPDTTCVLAEQDKAIIPLDSTSEKAKVIMTELIWHLYPPVQVAHRGIQTLHN